MKRASPTAHLCSVEGCARPWSVYFGQRLCALHARDRQPRQVEPPRHPPVPHWQDVEPRDEAAA